jgi:4-alpha-glucanotransferase
MTIDRSYLLHSPTAKQWQKVGIKSHHGIAIPLFSLHSLHSYGIGEWTDLKLLIDFCASVGFDVIQLLPLNDTGQGSSPYSALSAFALNSLFLSLFHLPFLDEYPDLKQELKALPQFSHASCLHYAKVYEAKNHFLRHYYRLVGPQLIESADYQQFIQTHRWLKGYAAFKILKTRHQWSEWQSWPKSESQPTEELLNEIVKHDAEEFHWHCLLQFLCDQQLREVKAYALEKNIYLMGDIPILIDRESSDVWLHKDLFYLEYSAGAPPDMFTQEGQNWGFPIYHWSNLSKKNYEWWIDRLKWANRYYDIYRIDHIVGFFRIWSIPSGCKSTEGHFIPTQPELWIDQGQKLLLTLINASDMLPIGEDLGVVPAEARACLNALGICGTRVMRWERRWAENGEFISPNNYAIDSLTTVATHDTETLQQWWKNQPHEAQLFSDFKGWAYHPILSREHHREILWDSHHSNSLFHINPLQEYLTLIPGLSWPNPDDDRINVPGTLSDQNWSYRLPLPLEELNKQNSLKYLMQEMIK